MSFISRVIAFLFSPEEGDTDGHFIDIMRCENKTEHPKNAGNTIHCRVLAVYSHDCEPGRELLWPSHVLLARAEVGGRVGVGG